MKVQVSNVSNAVKRKVIKRSIKNEVFKENARLIAYFNKTNNNDSCFTDIPTEAEVEEAVELEFEMTLIDIQDGDGCLADPTKYNLDTQLHDFLREELIRRFSQGISLSYGNAGIRTEDKYKISIIDGSLVENVNYNIRINNNLMKYFTAFNMIVGTGSLKTASYDILTDQISDVINGFHFPEEILNTLECKTTIEFINTLPVNIENIKVVIDGILDSSRNNASRIVDECLEEALN